MNIIHGCTDSADETPAGFTEVHSVHGSSPTTAENDAMRQATGAPGQRVTRPVLGGPYDQLTSYWGDCLATCTGRSMRRASMKAVFFS